MSRPDRSSPSRHRNARPPDSLAICLVLLAGLASAQPAAPAEPSRPDTAEAPAVTLPAAAVPQKSSGKAVLLSFLVPGGGQVYTGNWWKAALIAPAEVGLGFLAVRDHQAAMSALGAGNEDEYVRLRNRRNAFLWWTGAVLAFSMADAYVSAQLYGFEEQMRFTRSGRGGRLCVRPFRVGLSIDI